MTQNADSGRVTEALVIDIIYTYDALLDKAKAAGKRRKIDRTDWALTATVALLRARGDLAHNGSLGAE